MKTVKELCKKKIRREIEKKGLSKVSTIARALKTANEQLDEKKIDKTFKGKTYSDINKQVKEYEKKTTW